MTGGEPASKKQFGELFLGRFGICWGHMAKLSVEAGSPPKGKPRTTNVACGAQAEQAFIMEVDGVGIVKKMFKYEQVFRRKYSRS
jgi:hypothetical protein